MKVSLRWLEEFIDLPTDDPIELKYAFDMLGLQVESIEELSAAWTDVYIGRVLEIEPHPDADKVRVCQVDSGEGPVQIICGAWNFDVGATVAVARPGALLPGDFEIGVRSIRGVESHGMICSERELGLGDTHEGIMVLSGAEEVGSPLGDHVELPDVVFDLDVTPNRPDALSLVGIARDLAAWFDIDYSVPQVSMETTPGHTGVSIDVVDVEGCRRFTAREIVGVEVGPSPLKVRHRLEKSGVRAISNVVDATNYVMLELGHPLHAFDAEKIEGQRLVVKRAAPGEEMETLDGETRKLRPEDLIIYDDAGPTSMSGTMGGARSEVSESTQRVLMEAASWDPPTIMHMWRHHDLRSEAATRFERGVDPNLADVANKRATAMVASMAGGLILEGSVDVATQDFLPSVVDLDLGETERLLGEGFEPAYVASVLRRLGLEVEVGGQLRVTVPTFRPDLSRPADLVEEVARIHGFDKFEATLPTGPAGGLTPSQKRTRTLMQTLVGAGLSQAINLPFVSPEELTGLGIDTDETDLLTVNNPLREEESKLRPTILPGLLDDVRYNQSHGNQSVALFEIGTVFSTEPSTTYPRLPQETMRLGWVVVGDFGSQTVGGDTSSADASTSLAILARVAEALGADIETRAAVVPGFHPGRTAEVLIDGVLTGVVGELLPSVAESFEIAGRVAVAELDVAALTTEREPVTYQPLSVFPYVDFDLSFLVPSDVNARQLLAATRGAASGLLEDAQIFDEFRSDTMSDGERAIAMTYRLRSSERTLDAEAIAEVREEMIQAATKLGASLRGA